VAHFNPGSTVTITFVQSGSTKATASTAVTPRVHSRSRYGQGRTWCARGWARNNICLRSVRLRKSGGTGNPALGRTSDVNLRWVQERDLIIWGRCDRTGNKLGQYEVQDLSGKVAMGFVYRAYHAQLERTGAVKVLQAIAPDPDTTRSLPSRSAGHRSDCATPTPQRLRLGEYQGTPT